MQEDFKESKNMDDYPKKANPYTVSNNFDHVVVGKGHVKKNDDAIARDGDVTAL